MIRFLDPEKPIDSQYDSLAISALLHEHRTGNWGEACAVIASRNRQAATEQHGVLWSLYPMENGKRLRIVSVLLPGNVQQYLLVDTAPAATG